MSNINKWPVDGKEHQKVGKQYIYTNNAINNFLDNDNIMFVIASKGMGKTLLMRTKKNICISNGNHQYIIPRDEEFDEPKFTGLFNPKKTVKNIEDWKSIWELSIILSILSHIEHIEKKINHDLDTLFNLIENSIKNNNKKIVLNDLKHKILTKSCVNPSYFLNNFLTQFSSPEIGRIVGKIANIWHISKTYINLGVLVFIDAFDQTLNSIFKNQKTNDWLEIWKNGQLGLLKAAKEINSHNANIKIYTSIRQEAFSDLTDQHILVIKGKSLILSYSKDDLKKMFEKGISMYTNYKSIKDFIGFENIDNKFINKREDIFDYIYRHSVYTPRSIMRFAKEIDECDNKNEENIRRLVNDIGSNIIVDDYIKSEKIEFLNIFIDNVDFKKFMTLIPSNVLHAEALATIKEKYCEIQNISSHDAHPFCELYNIGLIGKVSIDNVDPNIRYQKFIKPHEYNWNLNDHLHGRGDDIYVIHPSLYDIISKGRVFYKVDRSNIIGNDLNWEINNNTFPQIFISHSSIDKTTIEENFLSNFQKEMNLNIPIKIWYDKDSIKAGDKFVSKVETGLNSTRMLLFFLSDNSLNSGWVKHEWETELEKEISEEKVKVICIKIDNNNYNNIPNQLKAKKAIGYKGDWNEMIYEVVNNITEHLKKD